MTAMTATVATAVPLIRHVPGERVSIHEPPEVVADPLPLFPDLPKPSKYPVAALGELLGGAVMGIADKIRVPTEMAAQSVLSVAAYAAQAQADVSLPFGQDRPLSLFALTIASSGDRKTSCDNEALRPVRMMEETLKEAFVAEWKEHRLAKAAWAISKKKIESDGAKHGPDVLRSKLEALGDEPLEPLSPYLTHDNLTMEGLAKNWPLFRASLAISTSEGGMFTGGHSMNEENRRRTASDLARLWDGQAPRRLRASDSAMLEGRRLSMHLLIQPDAGMEFLSDRIIRDQGLCSRLLVAAPVSLAGTRLSRPIDPASHAAVEAYTGRIYSILSSPWPMVEGTRNELAPRKLQFSEGARLAFQDFFDSVERQSGVNGPLGPISDIASKAAEYVGRIAGVLTVVDRPGSGTIQPAEVRRAIEIVNWYLAEAERIYQSARVSPDLRNAQLLLDWLTAREGDDCTFREIMNTGPNRLRPKKEADRAVATLAEHNRVIDRVIARPRTIRLIRGGN